MNTENKLLEDVKNMKVGSTCKWYDDDLVYTCRCRDDRYIIVTSKPVNKRNECMYSIFDLENMVCSSHNVILPFYDFVNTEDCQQLLEDLNNPETEVELSKRNMILITEGVKEVNI